MNCNMQNNLLTVIPTHKLGARFRNKELQNITFSNASGVTQIDGTVYCVKSSADKAIIYSTTNYQTIEPTYVESIGIIPFKCDGLTTDGTNLFLVGSANSAGKFIKVDMASKKISSYNLDKVYAGIAYCGDDSFYLVSYAADKVNFIITKYKTHPEAAADKYLELVESFEIVNRGYKERLQDIFYDDAQGLFVCTNQTKVVDGTENYSPCKNIILLYNLKNRTTAKVTPSTRFTMNYSTSQYTQFNTESVCIVNRRLVTVANVRPVTGGSADVFSYVSDMLFDKAGTFFIEHDVNVGRKIGNLTVGSGDLADQNDVKDASVLLTGLQSLCYANGKLVGLKNGHVRIKDGDKLVNDSDKPYVGFFEITGDYMSTTPAVQLKKSFHYFKSGQDSNLYHGNSMNYYNGFYYVGCAEPLGSGEYSIAKLQYDSNGAKFIKRYMFEHRTNAFAPYKDGKFILISGEGKLYYTDKRNGSKYTLRPIYIGTLNDANSKFEVSDTYYFKDTSTHGRQMREGEKHYMQDICYYDNYGLFVALCILENKQNNYTYQNDLAHIDLDKYEWVTTMDNKSVKMVVPDFDLVYKKRNVFSDVEYESPTIDTATGKMLVGVNAHKLPTTSGGNPPTYDCLLHVDGINFK